MVDGCPWGHRDNEKRYGQGGKEREEREETEKTGEREEIKHWGSGTCVVHFFKKKKHVKSEDLRPVPKQLEDQLSWNGGLSTQLGPEVMVQS